MSVTIMKNPPVTGSSPYTVSPETNQPASSPSMTSFETNGAADLPLPLEFSGSGDLVAEVAALLARSFREDRKQANESSDLEESNRLREGESRVAELHGKADEIRREGWARGLAQMGSAACNLAGGAMSLNTTDSHKADTLLSLWSGGGKGLDAGGTIVGNGYQADAVESQSNADRHESLAEANKAMRDKFGEQASDAKQLLEKVLQFVKEMNEVRDATMQTAASLKA